jgi:hypothetical protein
VLTSLCFRHGVKKIILHIRSEFYFSLWMQINGRMKSFKKNFMPASL